MGLSRLSEKCKKCPFVSKCNHKRMEALAYLPETSIISDDSMPIEMTVYKDEIEKQLYGSLYSGLGLNCDI